MSESAYIPHPQRELIVKPNPWKVPYTVSKPATYWTRRLNVEQRHNESPLHILYTNSSSANVGDYWEEKSASSLRFTWNTPAVSETLWTWCHHSASRDDHHSNQKRLSKRLAQLQCHDADYRYILSDAFETCVCLNNIGIRLKVRCVRW